MRAAHAYLQLHQSSHLPSNLPSLCTALQTRSTAAQPLHSLESIYDPGLNLNIVILYLLGMLFGHGIQTWKSITSPGCTAEGDGDSDRAKAVPPLSLLSC